jgi:hypothetical protein
MSNYIKSTNFASKDALASGNPLKIVKGTEIDTEFNNIATSISTKADSTSVQPLDTELTTLAGMSSDRATFLAGTEGFGFRNRIINGDMRIDQRNAGASVQADGAGVRAYAADRFYVDRSININTLTAQQVSTAPTGFTKSFQVTANASTSSPGTTDAARLVHAIEGFNVADLGWGASGAQSITLTFWVRASVTGNYGVGLSNAAANRSYVASFTVSAANTWEQKTITIPGDTAGTWATDNSGGIFLQWDLGVGTSLSTTAGTWSGSYFYGLTGGVKLVANASATFFITGVQLEAGSVATPFERRDYGRELIMCQRYFEIGKVFTYVADIGGYVTNPYSVVKRTTPTIVVSQSTDWTAAAAGTTTMGSGAWNTDATIGIYNPSTSHVGCTWTASAEL